MRQKNKNPQRFRPVNTEIDTTNFNSSDTNVVSDQSVTEFGLRQRDSSQHPNPNPNPNGGDGVSDDSRWVFPHQGGNGSGSVAASSTSNVNGADSSLVGVSPAMYRCIDCGKKSDESQNLKNEKVVNSILNKFHDLNFHENPEKDEMILDLINQARDLERQVKEREEWARQKAMQAARKLSNGLLELRILRMEREDTQSLNKGKQASEDTTMWDTLRETIGQVEDANLAIKTLKNENAKIKAEMEAYKLSSSESARSCLNAVKRKKKCQKKLGGLEKQTNKLHDDIAAEKQKISDLKQQLVELEAAKKEAEAKWNQELRAKGQVLAQVKEERRLKEAAEATKKRTLEAVRLRTEINFQLHKDNIQRLEQDLSRLKASAQTNDIPEGDVARMVHDLDRLEVSSENDVSSGRECLICMKNEVSVVLLPCAHQVICVNCNDNYVKKGRAICPCCGVTVEQSIRVFRATS